ncbi:MAG: PSD1 and planctomycete cytochrome C domain-containing protein, partial [Planctomycetota bacterium]|nr:PSD1 and planctomycete cytochrome C domain-containing protein [Planctomycetota bacterium]
MPDQSARRGCQRGLLALVSFASFFGAVASTSAVVAAEPAIEFNRDIRPILSDNCFACHGPDSRKRKAGLRLDVETSAKQAVESGATAIAPGKSAASELVARLITTDDSSVMPPPETGKKLTAAQIELLKRWIDEGAKWEGHWAFLPIRRQPPAAKKDPQFVRNPIDEFILAGLESQGLKHAPEADRITLLRRAHFDLVGLPPTPEEVTKFVNDQSPGAYEKMIERLLDSKHFGERMAMFWLDLVRYADSVGYHGDQPMSVTPFRDYAIDSFNSNKRFDQFTVEQIAGDLLPNATREQKIAAGYNRLGMMSAEGGVQDKEYLAKYIAERVRNVSGAWLGVTMGCCECHDHKFDPITSKEFYQMEAFFADIQERGLYSGSDQTGAWGASMPVPDADQEKELGRLDAELADLRKLLDQTTPELATAQTVWEQSVAPAREWLAPEVVSATSAGGATLSILPDRSILASGTRPGTDTSTVVLRGPISGITSIRVDVLPDDSLPAKGPGRADNGNFVLTEVSIARHKEGAEPQPVELQNASATIEQKSAADKHPDKLWSAASAIDGDTRGAEWGWAILDEAGRANHAVFETKANVDLAEGETLAVVLKQNHPNPHHTLGRFRISVSTAVRPVRATGAGLPRNIRDLLALPASKRSEPQGAELAAFYRTVAPELQPTRDKIVAVTQQREALNKKIRITLITVAVEPRMVRVLSRGNWMDESGDVVQPGVPASLGRPPAKDGRLNRLDLAKWMVSPENPLTSRVLVNRLWKQYFGAGLTRKLDDFGAQGEAPSHPELLDYLAARLIDSGWDLKQTIREMVTSGTYRQSSVPTADQRDKDPFNKWLARQSRFRIDAELVRDNALAVSGLLNEKVGGR